MLLYLVLGVLMHYFVIAINAVAVESITTSSPSPTSSLVLPTTTDECKIVYKGSTLKKYGYDFCNPAQGWLTKSTVFTQFYVDDSRACFTIAIQQKGCKSFSIDSAGNATICTLYSKNITTQGFEPYTPGGNDTLNGVHWNTFYNKACYKCKIPVCNIPKLDLTKCAGAPFFGFYLNLNGTVPPKKPKHNTSWVPEWEMVYKTTGYKQALVNPGNPTGYDYYDFPLTTNYVAPCDAISDIINLNEAYLYQSFNVFYYYNNGTSECGWYYNGFPGLNFGEDDEASFTVPDGNVLVSYGFTLQEAYPEGWECTSCGY